MLTGASRVLAAALLVTSFAAVAAPTAGAAPVCVWTRTALPTPSDRTAGDVTGGNDKGVYVGYTYQPSVIFAGSGPKFGAVWSGGQLVSSAAAAGTVYNAVNDAGTIAGYTTDANGVVHATTFTTAGAATALPEDPSWNYSEAIAINSAGDVAGEVGFGGSSHVVVWHAGAYKVLPQSASRMDLVHAIDDQGHVLADMALPVTKDEVTGVVWDADGTRHVLAGASPTVWHTTYTIRAGVVAGSYGGTQAALWTADGKLSAKIAGGTAATAIGATGTVGGQAYDSVAQKYSAVLWKSGQVVATLPTTRPTAGVAAVGPDDHTAAGSEFGRTWGGGPDDLPVAWRCM
jgi:hypothetical protein